MNLPDGAGTGKGRHVMAMYMYMGNQDCQMRCQCEKEVEGRMSKKSQVNAGCLKVGGVGHTVNQGEPHVQDLQPAMLSFHTLNLCVRQSRTLFPGHSPQESVEKSLGLSE